MVNKKDLLQNIIAFVFLALVFSIYFYSSLLQPENLLFAPGDGAKNYYTYLYHIKHDINFWKFEGMLYPYSENIIFTDNQPVLANFVKLFHQLFDFNTLQLISIHNYALFLGTVIGGFGIFLVLKKLNINIWFALFFAGALMMLQPQLQRFYSHYSMVYPVLPWVFYAWVQIWENTKPIKNAIFIGVLSIVFGLTHMYHFLTISVLCGLSLLLSIIGKQNRREIRKFSFLFIIMTIIPFVFLMMMTSLIEPEIDRPEKVWGFFSYHSYWEGLFFNNHHPIFHFINNNITEIRKIDPFEAFNYIGIISCLFIISGIIYSLINWRTLMKNLTKPLSLSGKFLWIFVLSACVSFGLPFTIKGLEWLLDYSGPYQQFRAIARVGWVSFYAINFVTIPYIFHRVRGLLPIIKYSILFLAITTLYWEAWLIKPEMKNPDHLEKAYQLPYKFTGLRVGDYQALISDPYLHAGSECFNWAPVGFNQDQFFEISCQIGIPSLVSIMSRTSLKQAIMMNQFVCKPYYVPSIIEELKLKDERPILVLESKLDLFSNSSSIGHWSNGTEIVFEHPEYVLRKLPLNHFDTIVKYFLDSLQNHPQDTLFSKSLHFEKSKKEKTWGFEAILYCDSTTRGDAVFATNIKIEENKDVNVIIEVWQITKEHGVAEQFSVRANYHYKKLSPDNMYIELPVSIKQETDKIAIRMYKDNQKEKHKITLKDPVLFSVRKAL